MPYAVHFGSTGFFFGNMHVGNSQLFFTYRIMIRSTFIIFYFLRTSTYDVRFLYFFAFSLPHLLTFHSERKGKRNAVRSLFSQYVLLFRGYARWRFAVIFHVPHYDSVNIHHIFTFHERLHTCPFSLFFSHSVFSIYSPSIPNEKEKKCRTQFILVVPASFSEIGTLVIRSYFSRNI